MMKSSLKLFISMTALLALCAAAVIPGETTRRTYVSRYENILGTSLELKIQASSEQNAGLAENAALTAIERLDKVLSGYDGESEFSKWMLTKGDAVKVSADLYQVLDLFDKWRIATSGALDPSAEIVSRVWKQAAAVNKLPAAGELKQAVESVRMLHYRLDPVNRTATHLDDSPLILNSFAKSYVIDKASKAAAAVEGVSSVIVNIGGDILVSGDHTEQVDISDPLADAENDAPLTSLDIGNRAVATSGSYRRGVMIGGNRYSHIIDPRTGLPAGNIISATVVAPEATDAGALATAFNVLKPEESRLLASAVKGADYLIITRDGKRYESDGWKSLEHPAPEKAEVAVARSKDKLWDTKFELLISLELAKIEGTRVHPPYVAIWVTDRNNQTVRNIALWFAKPRWLADLKTWNKANGAAFTAENSPISSISSATRSPGKYTLKWDGKDDKGQLVVAGDYTINIEAAREHGTYQLMTSPMKFTGKAQQVTLNGNVEIASASLNYRKKAN